MGAESRPRGPTTSRRVLRTASANATGAFVRFASVYRDFKDVDQFMATLKGLLETTRE